MPILSAADAFDEVRCVSACRHIAREIVRPTLERYSGQALTPSVKDDDSLVTEADRVLETRIREYVRDAFPGFGILGEELEPHDCEADYVWTIDPIDGTEAFAAGLPLFGTLLAVVDQREPTSRRARLGALYMPMQDWLVIGNGARTTLNGEPIAIPPAAGARSRLLVGDLSELRRKLPPQRYRRTMDLVTRFRSTHTWGDCYGYVAMLTGKAHARIDHDLGVDDIAPIEPIIMGAGGVVTTGDGAPLAHALSALTDLADRRASFDIVCAATMDLHQHMLSALSGPDANATSP